jgi:ribosome-binding factor A
MADPARAKKIADRIKVLVAETLEFRVKDERLGFVTITDVRVTGDLQNASVFYTVFGGEAERAETAAALESAKGKLRSAVGKGIGIRLTPTLEFIPDALPEGAAHLEGLLQTAKQRDAEVAAARAGATYAGDPDPYKKPAADEEDPTDDDAAVDVAPAGDDPSTGDHHATDDHSTDDHPTTDDDHS